MDGFPAGSVISHSATVAGIQGEAKKKLAQGKFSKVDSFFPIFDAIAQLTRLPNVLYILCTVYLIFQLFTISNWVQILETANTNSTSQNFINKLNLIGKFSEGQNVYENSDYVPFYLILAIFALALLFLLICYIFYKQYHTFPSAVLYLNRILLEIVVPVFIIPTGSYIGFLTSRLINKKNGSDSAIVIITCLIFIFFWICYSTTISLLSASPFLKQAITAAWNPVITSVFVPVSAIFCFFEYFSMSFPRWWKIAVIIVHILVAVIVFFRAYHLLYIRSFFNALAMALCCGIATQDAVNLVKLFASSIPPYLGVLVGFSISAILTPVFYFLNEQRMAKIQHILSHNEEMDEDTTFEMILSQNGVLHSSELALNYIHVGLATHADYFVDWSLIKILSNSTDSTTVLIECLKMISFFPPESRLLNLLMNVVFSRRDLSFTNRFVIYEIQRIKSSRQSSSSSELTEQYNKMVNITEQCFNEISGFWSHVPSDYIVFQNIGKQILEAKRNWEEELSTYPNNYRFREEYARFLIECDTDFTGGILQKHKSTLIDQGFSFSVDYAFKAFIRTYPEYLKKKVVDVKGNILVNGGPKKGSSSQNSGPSSGQVESLGSSDMLDAEVEEQIGKQLFRNARMRISLQNSLRRRKCAPIRRMQIFTIINLFICIAAALFYCIMFDGIYQSRYDTIQNYLDVNGFREDIAMITLLFLCLHELFTGEVNLESKAYMLFLKLDYERGLKDGTISTEEYPDVTTYVLKRDIFIRQDQQRYIYSKAASARIKLNNVMDRLSTMDDDPGDVADVAAPFIEEQTSITYCSNQSYILKIPQSVNADNTINYLEIPMKDVTLETNSHVLVSFQDPKKLPDVKKTLQTLVTYQYFIIQQLALLPPDGAFSYFRNVYFCAILANMDKMSTNIQPFYDALNAQQERMHDHHVKVHHICEIILCIFIPISCIPALYSALILFFNEERRLIKLMREIDTNAKDDAAQPIMKLSSEKEDGVQHVNQAVDDANSQGLGRLILISSMVFLFYAGYDVLIFGGLYLNEQASTTFRNINYWTYYSSTTYPIIVEALNLVTLGILIEGDFYFLRARLCLAIPEKLMGANPNGNDYQDKVDDCEKIFHYILDIKSKIPADYVTTEQAKELAAKYITDALVYNAKMTTGEHQISGFDEDIDKINFEDACDGTGQSTGDPNAPDNIYLQLRCSSLMQGFEVVQGYLSMTIENIHSQHGINQSVYLALAYVIVEHMKDHISSIDNILLQKGEDLLDSLSITKIVFTIAEIIFSFIIFGVIWAIINWVEIGYTTALVLIRRLTPQSIVASGPLLDYLLNRKSIKTEGEMTLEHSVMHNSSDAILCLSRIEVIEVVNLAVTSLLGYTPEQLLGQPISILVNEGDQQQQEPTQIAQGIAPVATQPPANDGNEDSAANDFLRHLDLMRSGQTNLQYECHLTCIADDDSRIACQAILIGMPGDRSNEASSFVVIFRNEEELLRQQKEAEEAKKQSENLLYHILPRDIVVRLNQGEKNISFSVPSATIIFLDIQKFSEYAASLSPSQIMGHLSMIFDSFDRIIVKYPLLIKIKLIGDIYMAAGGLFNPTSPPQQHAEQVVRFALEALQELEDVNLKLSSSLQIRIGVNTSGPLIAGVLGTDKPVFDIIGDPINVAARLQSTDIPNRVQISQSTYDLIASLDFNIEKRGEVFLKGKGKANAYLVIPTNAFSINSENSTPA